MPDWGHADVGSVWRQAGVGIVSLFGMTCQLRRCLRKNYFV
jgi:hypothetical protein